MNARSYRRRPDGVIELIPRRSARVRELLVSTGVAIGGLALTFAFAVIIASTVQPSNFQRTSGLATVCWNWSAGPSGCFTR